MNKVVYPLIKTIALIVFWYILKSHDVSWKLMVPFMLAGIYAYQLVIAKMFGLIMMPAMDQACFISTSRSHANFVSVTFFEGNFDEEWLAKKFKDWYIETFEKYSYRVVMKYGDIYYKKMTKQEAFEKGVHIIKDPKLICRNRRDIEMWVEDNLNQKLPLDGP